MMLNRIFTPANELTLTRMLLIPCFAILLIYGYRGWALVTFAAAGLTDLLDGLIARLTGGARIAATGGDAEHGERSDACARGANSSDQ